MMIQKLVSSFFFAFFSSFHLHRYFDLRRLYHPIRHLKCCSCIFPGIARLCVCRKYYVEDNPFLFDLFCTVKVC